MNKKEWQKILLGVLIALLFGLILLTILNFTKNPENVVIEDDPLIKEEIKFLNNSTMSEKEIRELLEEKRENFKNFIKNIEFYKISEVGEEFTSEDDDKYLVLGESTLTKFKELATEELYNLYWNQMTEVNIKYNIQIKEKVYYAPIDLFDTLYSNSAIAQINVTEEALILKNATDEKIEAIENIKLCEEDEEYCKRDDKYNYVLQKEEGTWKIAKLI